MKRIYFSRHAKSSWADLSLKDIDRPLNKRGLRDAPIMADKLALRCEGIDILISSPAKRTMLTRTFFEQAITHKALLVDPKIYEATRDEVLEVINDLDDKYQSALLFGHNPAFTYLYNHFSEKPLDNLPTSGLFGITSSAETWSDVDTTNSNMEFLIYPKMYIS